MSEKALKLAAETAVLLDERLERLENALAGLVGLVEMIRRRDDVSVELQDVLITNHRVIEATAALSDARSWQTPATRRRA